MLIISYDIKDTKLRTKFSKMLQKNGCIRLQMSVYEFNNTNRLINNIRENIKNVFAQKFTPEDSVLIFHAPNDKVEKYGSAIHLDHDAVFL